MVSSREWTPVIPQRRIWRVVESFRAPRDPRAGTRWTADRLIDLHSHVLPGVDDGPPDLAGSIAMADVAWRGGTRRLVATPHVRDDHPRVVSSEIQERVADLNRALATAGVSLEVLPGAEIDLGAALELSDEDLAAATLGAHGSHLLIETPYGALPSVFESLLGRVRDRGYPVVLAHPELNPSFQHDPGRLVALARDGVLVQVTARSLRSARRSPARELALRSVREGFSHVLASDGHSAQWRPPALGPELADAVRRMPELEARLTWMVTSAPECVLTGQAVPAPPPVDESRRRAWRPWR